MDIDEQASQSPASEDYEEIVARLQSIAEELGDRAMAQLRRSIEDDGNTYDAEQKRLGKARRAIEKAAHLLGDGSSEAW